MSLYSALFSGVSGLSAQSAAMAGVADNITNINTVGYKAVDTQFSTLVGDGRAGNRYMAGGVTATSKALVANKGLLQTSSNSTDLGIDGQGFFLTRTGTAEDSPVALTRAGSFATDQEGYLRNSAGLYLQGWRLNTTGGYENTGTADSLEPIRVSDLTGTATSTSKLTVRANFQSTTDNVAGYAVGEMAAYAADPNAAAATITRPSFDRPMDIYDAQGGAHRVTLGVVKTAANTWQAELYVVPAADVTQAGGVLASGTITFDGNGRLASLTGTLAGPVTPVWTNGASAQPIRLDFGQTGSQDGFSQSGDKSFLSSSIDGGLLGNVASISVSKTGEVSAVFDDGSLLAVFQLPIATVANPNGLTRTSGNGYTVSELSGAYALNEPGSLGAGNISAFSLEASTADLAQEFTNMIRFQRAYSASSKIITTVDDMLQEVSNLKR